MMKKLLAYLTIAALFALSLFQVSVYPAKAATEEKFLIGVFWPPVADYTNAEQYDYLKDAHINYIQNVLGNDLNDSATNMKMLDLAAERGMKVSVADDRFGDMLNVTDEQIQILMDDYKDHPAFAGMYIKDEPSLPLYERAAHVYNKMLEQAPGSLPHLNLLPSHTPFFQKWIDTVGKSKLKYLSYDFYPFRISGTRTDYFQSLDDLRSAGLKNQVKTMVYLQSVGIPGNLARPDENMLRYNVYTYLAYGVKAVNWFTWWTPTNRSEPFTDAILTPDGQKTDLFEPVKQLNGEMEKLGPTLMKLDALEVFHAGNIPSGGRAVPDHFFWKPASPQDDLVLTHFRNRTNGKLYIMAVNKSLTESKTVQFHLDKDRKIDQVTEVSKQSGAEVQTNHDEKNGALSGTFLPGEGKLYALPDDFQYQIPDRLPAEPPAVGPNNNLAFRKNVMVSSDIGRWGWSAANAVDGQRTSSGNAIGWTSYSDLKRNHTEWITIDTGSLHDIDTVDLYPRSDTGSLGFGFPIDFTIQVSQDNANWTTVVTGHITERPSSMKRYEFPPVPARYVKVEGTNLDTDSFGNYHMQLAEIEIYAKTGSQLNIQMTPSKLLAEKSGTLQVHGWTETGEVDPLDGAAKQYRSSDTGIATVDAQGVVTAHSEGTAVISVTVTKSDGQTETAEYEVTVEELPSPWKADFYGNAYGLITQTQNGFEMKAAGQGIGQTGDDLVYLYQNLSTVTPVSITAAMESLYQASNGTNGQAGIMFRSGKDSDAAAATVNLSINPEGRMLLTARTETGDRQEIKGDYAAFPTELKLVKTGNRFAGFYKKDGNWIPMNEIPGQSAIEVNMEESIQAGIAAFSQEADLYNLTKISGIQIKQQPEH